MATESNVQPSHGVRTYRGRTLEELLPQIREELGPDAIILREREGLVGGVGGFFAQRFIEVEARSGADPDDQRGAGPSIDIYDEDDELGFERPPAPATTAQPRLPVGELTAGDEPPDISASRQTPVAEPKRSEPRPFVPPELQRERIIPRDPRGEPAPTRRFETDVFLQRLREASQMLPDDDEDPQAPGATPLPALPAPAFEPATAFEPAPAFEPEAPPQTAPRDSYAAGPAEAEAAAAAEREDPAAEREDPAAEREDAATETKPRRAAHRTPAQRKPRPQPQRRARPAPPGSAAAKGADTGAGLQEPPQPAARQSARPAPEPVDPWSAAMAALVAEPEPEPASAPRPGVARPAPREPAASETTRNPYEAVRRRPPSLRAGLPTESAAAAAAAARGGRPSPATPQPAAPSPASLPVAPLEVRGRHDGALRGVLARLFGGRFGASSLPKPSAPHPLDATAAGTIAGELSQHGASQTWTNQLIGTAGAHGTALSGGLAAAVEAELARGIVAAPTLPATGAAVAFIGAGGSGKTRCTAALASAYSRASTLGVTVIAVDNPSGARELKRLLESDGVPVLSLSGERARRAVAAYRTGGFVIVDTPTATPTDPAALEALGANLAPLELDATFVTLPATLGPQAARRALAGFGRLNPSAVAITHADETDQLAVVVEIAVANRIPLAYFHAGTDHRSALSAVDAGTLAQQLLTP